MLEAYDGDERRHDSSSQLVASIAAAIREEFANLTVPEEMHREHHEFIRAWIDRQKKKDERNEKIRAQVGGWAIIAGLGGIGKAAYEGLSYLKDHFK